MHSRRLLLACLLYYSIENHSFLRTIHHLASGGILIGMAERLLKFYAYHWTLPPSAMLTNMES